MQCRNNTHHPFRRKNRSSIETAQRKRSHLGSGGSLFPQICTSQIISPPGQQRVAGLFRPDAREAQHRCLVQIVQMILRILLVGVVSYPPGNGLFFKQRPPPLSHTILFPLQTAHVTLSRRSAIADTCSGVPWEAERWAPSTLSVLCALPETASETACWLSTANTPAAAQRGPGRLQSRFPRATYNHIHHSGCPSG